MNQSLHCYIVTVFVEQQYLGEEFSKLPELLEVPGHFLLEVEFGQPADVVHVHLQGPGDPS